MMNKLVHFEVAFKLRFQNFDFFQRNIPLINKVSPLDILLHTTVLCWIENSRAVIPGLPYWWIYHQIPENLANF